MLIPSSLSLSLSLSPLVSKLGDTWAKICHWKKKKIGKKNEYLCLVFWKFNQNVINQGSQIWTHVLSNKIK
jgi:hypothetical protein